ncbi:MAG: chorismate-binding protein [Candidatus Bathyarchaeota archaeon]
MVTCPKCNQETNLTPVKEWDLTPKTRKGPKLHVKLYEHCGKKFRKAEKISAIV